MAARRASTVAGVRPFLRSATTGATDWENFSRPAPATSISPTASRPRRDFGHLRPPAEDARAGLVEDHDVRDALEVAAADDARLLGDGEVRPARGRDGLDLLRRRALDVRADDDQSEVVEFGVH